MEKECLVDRIWINESLAISLMDFRERFHRWADTPAEQLAVAIILGDEKAALILSDLVQEEASEKPKGYVGRKQLVGMLLEFSKGLGVWLYREGHVRICRFCHAENSHTESCEFTLVCKEGE